MRRRRHLHRRQPPPPLWWPFFATAILLHSTSRPFEERNHIATMAAKAGQPNWIGWPPLAATRAKCARLLE